MKVHSGSSISRAKRWINKNKVIDTLNDFWYVFLRSSIMKSREPTFWFRLNGTLTLPDRFLIWFLIMFFQLGVQNHNAWRFSHSHPCLVINKNYYSSLKYKNKISISVCACFSFYHKYDWNIAIQNYSRLSFYILRQWKF